MFLILSYREEVPSGEKGVGPNENLFQPRVVGEQFFKGTLKIGQDERTILPI